MQCGQQRCAVVFTVILGKNAANQRPNLGFLRRMPLYFLCVFRDLQQDSPLLAAHVDIVNLARRRICQAIFGVFRGTFIRLPERLTQQNQGVTRIRRFRKRTQREKDGIYQDAVADTVKKFLPVYDNLERALHHETADEAYKKGVEMTLTELVKILDALGVKPFGEAGETFDPQRHNAVMHIEDESLGENVIAEVFQTGFAHGDKVIRFAMVKVAN